MARYCNPAGVKYIPYSFQVVSITHVVGILGVATFFQTRYSWNCESAIRSRSGILRTTINNN